MRWWPLFVGIGALASAVACSKGDEAGAPRDKVASGAAIYASMCKGCHGARGEGGSGPSLRDEYTKKDEAALDRFIDANMPLGEPDRCRGACAEDVGAYVFYTFRGPIVCDRPAPVARGVRLLTRREYKATIADLLGVDTGAASTAPAPSACPPASFTYDPKGRVLATVHVAGDFNAWAGTIAAGGWPLAKTAGGTWSLTRAVASGSHAYKLVLNESEWIVDPANPKTAPNGIGGDNSILDVTCPSAGGSTTSASDPTAGFPPDTRPEGFVFDDHGPGRVVTPELMDEYFRAATKLAAMVDLAAIVSCDRSQRDSCARATLERAGTRAFRRPLSDAELARFTKVASAAADFDAGIRVALRAILSSPSFVYRSEVGEKQSDGTYRLGAWEIASALSYFFWGTMPDDALFDAARSGELVTAAGLERHARRLLADPRARTMVATFGEQWLGVDSLDQLTKADPYPFDPALRAAMREETRRLVTHVVFDGSHSLGELFTADYTFANDALAKHYGLPPISGGAGSTFQQVKVADGRAGILGHASVLASTGHSDQSSPIRRGLFVRRRLLCQDFPPPPPNAGGVPKVDPSATTRERFAQHTANAFCKTCHQYIDDVGFGFERFDTVGRKRDSESGKPIDSQGDMNDVEGLGSGTHAPYASLGDLGKVLAASESARACVTRQVYGFARGQAADDVCKVQPIEQRWLASGGDLRELLVGVVTDPAFVLRAP